jgi:hypothetical protein
VWIRTDLHKRMSLMKVHTGEDLKAQAEEAIEAYLDSHTSASRS